MFIVLLLEICFGKLSLLVIEICTALGFNSRVIVADHSVTVGILCCIVLCCFHEFGDAEC
jgi:hypothetical protein